MGYHGQMPVQYSIGLSLGICGLPGSNACTVQYLAERGGVCVLTTIVLGKQCSFAYHLLGWKAVFITDEHMLKNNMARKR